MSFQPNKGTKLATFAARCIENEILMHLCSLKKTRKDLSLHDPIGTDKEGNEITLIDIFGSEADDVVEKVQLRGSLNRFLDYLCHCDFARGDIIKALRFIMILSIVLTLTGCIKVNHPEIITDVAGDVIYFPNDYHKQLDSMELSEIVSLPHFTEPFVSIAQDQQQQQFAVLFYKVDQVRTVKLPVTFEDIVKKLETEGAKIEGSLYPKTTNLIMFEHNNQLFWCYGDGKLLIYLNLNGKKVNPYQK